MNSAQILLFIVNDLLDLFRIKNGKFVKNEAEVQFRDEIKDIIDIFAVQAEGKGLNLDLLIGDTVPETLHIDIQRVK